MLEKFNVILSRILKIMVILSVAIISIIIMGQVFFRYFFGRGFAWIIDYSIILFVYIVFIGAALASYNEDHIEINAMSIILDKIDEKYFLILNILKNILVAIVVIIAARGAIDLLPITATQRLRATRFQRSIINYPIIISAISMLLFAISNAIISIKDLLKLKNKNK